MSTQNFSPSTSNEGNPRAKPWIANFESSIFQVFNDAICLTTDCNCSHFSSTALLFSISAAKHLSRT